MNNFEFFDELEDLILRRCINWFEDAEIKEAVDRHQEDVLIAQKRLGIN